MYPSSPPFRKGMPRTWHPHGENRRTGKSDGEGRKLTKKGGLGLAKMVPPHQDLKVGLAMISASRSACQKRRCAQLNLKKYDNFISLNKKG